MTQPTDVARRTRVTRPYPTYTLEDALSVARAIYEVNAGLPFDRELLAGALGTTPKSSAFTMRLNASAAYGLTEGGYNDPDIRLTDLGEAVVSSSPDEAGRGDAVAAAATNPDTFGRFYRLFDGRRLPQSNYLHNILERELGIRSDLADECLGILWENGEFAGLIAEGADGAYHVRLPEPHIVADAAPLPNRVATEMPTPYIARPEVGAPERVDLPGSDRSVFIGHIGDSDAADYVVSMLDDFGIVTASPRISEDDTGLLVPQEVSQAMRDSRAAVLVFRSGDDAWSSRDKMIGMLGASSVLFDDRVVLLHEDGERMSISLEGLNHIDFDHERPGESGMNLLVALHKAGVINVTT
ncbi:MAG: hypothetical protein F4X34_00615 [Chloroflexi bacterium]|nr:hypothetical protein [Chloroflexota bacterium]